VPIKCCVFEGKRDDDDAGEGRKNAGCWWLTVDPSRGLSETRRYAWEFVAFDDQEVGVPAPHNSALARVYCARSLVDPGPRSQTAIGPAAFASQVESGWMKMSELTHREPTWKDTNAPVRARSYNKSSACMCAERRTGREEVRQRHASAYVRESDEITRNLRRRHLPRDHYSLACVADRLDLIRRFGRYTGIPISFIFPIGRPAMRYVSFITTILNLY
jgi:hypothetical protein